MKRQYQLHSLPQWCDAGIHTVYTYMRACVCVCVYLLLLLYKSILVHNDNLTGRLFSAMRVSWRLQTPPLHCLSKHCWSAGQTIKDRRVASLTTEALVRDSVVSEQAEALTKKRRRRRRRSRRKKIKKNNYTYGNW